MISTVHGGSPGKGQNGPSSDREGTAQLAFGFFPSVGSMAPSATAATVCKNVRRVSIGFSPSQERA